MGFDTILQDGRGLRNKLSVHLWGVPPDSTADLYLVCAMGFVRHRGPGSKKLFDA